MLQLYISVGTEIHIASLCKNIMYTKGTVYIGKKWKWYKTTHNLGRCKDENGAKVSIKVLYSHNMCSVVLISFPGRLPNDIHAYKRAFKRKMWSIQGTETGHKDKETSSPRLPGRLLLLLLLPRGLDPHGAAVGRHVRRAFGRGPLGDPRRGARGGDRKSVV